MSDYSALREASLTLQQQLKTAFDVDPQLTSLFGALGYTVSLKSPKEMRRGTPPEKGLSVWLYQLERSEMLNNRPPVRVSPTELKRPPLPVNLHYLFTPLADAPATEQLIMGKVLEVLNDGTTIPPDPGRPELRETLRVSLETLDLESITRVWTALEAPYELCMSYLVHVVDIESGDDPLQSAPVIVRDSRYEQVLEQVRAVTRRTLVLSDLTTTVSDDLRPTWQAVITGRVVDDLATLALPLPQPDGLSVVAQLRGVDATAPGEVGRFRLTTSAGGLFAISAVVERAFPDLATVAHVVDLTISAPGYLGVTRSVNVPAGTTTFPLTVPDVGLRRPAVRFVGRAMSTGAAPTPLPGRTVTVTAPAGLAGLRSTTTWAHASGTPFTPVTLTPAGSDLGLRAEVGPGDTALSLTVRTGLAPGAAIRLGTPPDDEVVLVAATGIPAALADPGTVTLTGALVASHRPGDPAIWVTVAPSGPAATASLDVDAGARIAFVDHPERLPEGQDCRVDDADPARVELRTAHAPVATTDAEGYFRTGPVGGARVATVQITPSVGPVTVDALIRFDVPDNVVNFTA